MLWTTRNFVWQGKNLPASASLCQDVRSLLEAYQEDDQLHAFFQPGLSRQTSWIPPRYNLYKINVDDTLGVEDDSLGVGIVIHI